ncbi:MAG: leucyl/phenylalanyl-tRNA--protein transferase [Bacteroidia bacterium]|jgi:leucyl/phenylalanyl-tRNA--protein transferase
MVEEKLKPAQLIYAYSNGYFPMADDPEEGGEIYWHRPEQRGIIPLDSFHVSKNMKRFWRKNPYTLKLNTAFREVIKACAERDRTWINDEIIDAYSSLSEMGYALSFEVWDESELVGGLYGVTIGKAFFGESMFSKASNTSKLALMHLVTFMKENDFVLLDTQYLNTHLEQFGAVEIPDKNYMEQLASALANSL